MRALVVVLALAACGGSSPSTPDAPAAPPAPPAAPAAAPAAAAPTAAAPTDVGGMAHGKSVVIGQCTGCHGLDVYTRPDHKMQDAQMLDAQVDTCGGAAGIDDASKQDVKDYLAKEVYRFEG